MSGAPRPVAYILKKFPVLSETFVLQEILTLERNNIPVHIFSMERPNDPRFHSNLHHLKAHITYVPDVLDLGSLRNNQKRAASKFGKDYRRAHKYALKHYTTPDLYWRFLQSCYIAIRAARMDARFFHAHFATRPTSVAFLASMITGIPYSFTAHAMDIFKVHLSRKALARKIEAARCVITISDYNKRFLTEISPASQDKILLVRNGIDMTFFEPPDVVSESPQGFRNGRRAVFLCVARFVEKKGHVVLIEACRILREQGVEFEVWLAGKGRLRSPIELAIKESGLRDRVLLLGAKTEREVRDLYRSCDAFVLPCIVGEDGNREGLPVSIVEALASGLPVITTPVTGNPEAVEDGRNGLMVPEQDPEALAGAMKRLIEEPALRTQLARQARPSVADRFDIGKVQEQLVDIFRNP